MDRGSETQLQVAKNLNLLAQCSKGSALNDHYVFVRDFRAFYIWVLSTVTIFRNVHYIGFNTRECATCMNKVSCDS